MKQIKITPQEAIDILQNEVMIRPSFDNTPENAEEYYKREAAIRVAIDSIKTLLEGKHEADY